jgi:hypothetical protein
MILLLSLGAYAQDNKTFKPWRTITPSTIQGVSFTGDYVTTTSVALDWQFNAKYSLDVWAGVSYNNTYKGGWSSLSAFVSRPVFKKWRLGAGLMYGSGNQGSSFANSFDNKDLVFGIRFSRRFHLNR